MIDKNVCIACGACVGICPVGAIKYETDGKPQIDPEVCIQCGACAGMCPVGAIDISDVSKHKK